jgi:hypothetical protein
LRSNCLLKYVIEGKLERDGQKWLDDEEEGASSYRMTLGKREDTAKWKRKH